MRRARAYAPRREAARVDWQLMREASQQAAAEAARIDEEARAAAARWRASADPMSQLCERLAALEARIGELERAAGEPV